MLKQFGEGGGSETGHGVPAAVGLEARSVAASSGRATYDVVQAWRMRETLIQEWVQETKSDGSPLAKRASFSSATIEANSGVEALVPETRENLPLMAITKREPCADTSG